MLLVSTTQGKQVVASLCERAEAVGVQVGMSLAHARSRFTNVRFCIQPFTPEEDARQLDRLARWALRFSPLVAPDYPDGLWLDIAGCEHLYGGEERLAEKLAASLERLGFAARLAVAPTYACAQAVARYGKNRITIIPDHTIKASLRSLPVSALRVDRVTREALTEVGIAQLGQLLSLPRPELAARFGGELLRRIDQALGLQPERMEPISPKKPLELARRFDGPVTHIETIEAAVDALLPALITELQKQGRGVRHLTIELRRVPKEPVRMSFSLTHPTRDRRHLRSLIHSKLERLHLGYGIEELRLRATQTERVCDEQMELWPQVSSEKQPGDGAALGRLLDQLIDRLGKSAVTQLEQVETYVPEQAFAPKTMQETRTKKSGRKVSFCQGNFYPVHRPSRLFTVPEPVRVMAVVPDGPPAWFKWRSRACAISFSYGPERIALPWWTGNASDGAFATRDYYEVQDEHGRWLWLFRDRESRRWFVHGEWA